ncbi:aminoglycoside phosphotransferase family protein [Nocardioides sp. zg-1228]|uniref:aminoglycoside phosphotransferase family protein n=1 Tax=Nocardioides sp. zg-1228 TaxID=2763008 RepID=UPI0016425E5D|nr:aminoglycoside phosphotransferase family protein [Nocardioides sp. zg-1228]MBC2934980.1 aminoglycoside phosphotransferase family protein [Nocardioides sp. zg-1228]QSF56155.1 aminoglycoside phosphotransferase family protein [Nocardioides sp. zg-1228]
MPHTHDVEVGQNQVRKTFVSWSLDEPEREWGALKHLSAYAPGLAPSPIARTEVGGRPTIVMSRVPGAPLAGEITGAQTQALARALRRLFDVPVPPGLAVRANDPLGFSRRFKQWLAEEYDWSECQDAGLVREAVESARLWLDQHLFSEGWIVDPVIALGDGNLDNVLWDGETCRLIDWEEYGVSDLAYEVADIVEHASSRLENRLEADALIEAIFLSESQRRRVEQHRPFFAAFWLAMLLPGNAGWGRNPTGSTEDQSRHLLRLLEGSGRQ